MEMKEGSSSKRPFSKRQFSKVGGKKKDARLEGKEANISGPGFMSGNLYTSLTHNSHKKI